MNLVLNDNVPSPAPTNGCCASVADVASPAKISMAAAGSPGSSSTTGVSPNSHTSNTVIYYIGVSGDYSGLSFSAGTWTIPLKLSSITGTPIIDSIYICQANSSGTSLGSIGSSTGIATTLSTGVNSFSVTGSTSATFGTGDVVVISFQIHGTGTFSVAHDQTITTPSTSGGSSANYFPPAARVRARNGVPTLVNTSTGSVTYSPLSARLRMRGMAPTLVMGQTYTPNAARIRTRGGAHLLAGSGTVNYSPRSGLVRFRAAPTNASPLFANIRFRRGPYTKVPAGWPEGAPYEAGVVLPNGSVFEMLFLGGHDGQDKIVGAGFQTCSGTPSWSVVSDGSWVPAILDSTNLKLWFYVNGGWHFLTLT